MATILKELTPENISSNYTLSTIKKVNDTLIVTNNNLNSGILRKSTRTESFT